MGCNNLNPADRFTSTNQPPPESKRGPKNKTRFIKAIKENWPAFEEMLKKGNSKAWEMAIEQFYGKGVQPTDNTNRFEGVREINIDFSDKKQVAPDDSQTDISDKV